MTTLPTILASSVVRGTRQGDSHGGLYLVDLTSEKYEQVLDWNTCDIDFEGRGADRGLRGIVVHEGETYVAASDELFVFDRNFKILRSFRNAYLKHCHEIWRHGPHIYLSSTGFDSILRFDLAASKFDLGVHVVPAGDSLSAKFFDPNTGGGPLPGIRLHINSVYVDQRAMFVAGRNIGALVRIRPSEIAIAARLPLNTHNARPFGEGVLFNDTESDCLRLNTGSNSVSIPVPRFRAEDLSHTDLDDSKIARQGFGRGLCPLSETLVAAGSSPSTVSVYDLRAGQRLKSVNITLDIRNAVHGMAIWPF